MINTIRELVRKAFDPSELYDALEEKISGYIDYDDIAGDLLDDYADEIASEAKNAAEDIL